MCVITFGSSLLMPFVADSAFTEADCPATTDVFEAQLLNNRIPAYNPIIILSFIPNDTPAKITFCIFS